MGLARESRAISRVYLRAPVINGPFLVERESILHIRNICTHVIHTRARIMCVLYAYYNSKFGHSHGCNTLDQCTLKAALHKVPNAVA